MSAPHIEGNDGKGIGKELKLKCPTCKQLVKVQIPPDVKNFGKGGLVNVLIPDTSTPCGHAMQFFLDANYRVRGYTRIDYVNDLNVNNVSKVLENGSVKPTGTKNQAVKIAPPAQQLDEKDESLLSEREIKLKRKINSIIKDFATKVGEVKAIACFDYDGYVFAKALNDDIKLEEISMLSAAMLTQSTFMAKSLNMRKLENFTITSRNYMVSVMKAGELLLLLYFSRAIKPGLMNFYLKNLVKDIEKGQLNLT